MAAAKADNMAKQGMTGSIPMAIIAILVAASCSGGGSTSSTSATTSAPVTSSVPTSAPIESSPPSTTTATTAPPTTVPAPPLLPAGVQFSTEAVLPSGFTVQGTPASNGTLTLIAGKVGTTSDGTSAPALAESTDGVTWQLVPLPTDGFRAPSGHGINRSGFFATDVAAGAPGFVATGDASWWSSGFASATRAGFVWQSSDGQNWQLIDLRPIVGGGSRAIRLNNVQWVENQFVITGADGPLSLSGGPSQALVLTSPDGVTWTALAQPPTVWSSELNQAMDVGGHLAVAGYEYVCTDDAGAFATFSLGLQPRLWGLGADGQTWTPVSIPQHVLGPAKPNPTDASGCPDPNSPDVLTLRDSTFRQPISALGPAAGAVVAWSADHSVASVTTDLVNWTTATVPGAVPTASTSSSTPTPPDATLLSDDEGAVELISLEARRDEGDSQAGVGLQSIAWTWNDGAWQRQVAARPVLVNGNALMSRVGASVWLIDQALGESTVPASLTVSAAGPLESWGSCIPAANAQCSFSRIDGQDLHGQNLDGIDLRGSAINKTDLSGATLNGARLDSAYLSSDTLTGATFAGATLVSASLSGEDLTGVDLSNANLTSALVPTSLFAAKSLAGAILTRISVDFEAGDTLANMSLAGLDLTGASFDSLSVITPMTNVDLSGANLSDAVFGGVDLTGANLEGANLTNVTFLAPVTCPDGQPLDPTVFGAPRCRL